VIARITYCGERVLQLVTDTIGEPVLPYGLVMGGSMGELKGSQRKYLRGVAHGFKPLVQIGKEGLSEGVIHAIDDALEAHELIKVKIAAERDERAQFVPAIEERAGCECVGTVGRMAILFRQHPDPEKRKISLPIKA
jgi:RNA-binding protein